MRQSTDRILTTHVGSLVRTPEIIRAMRAITSGRQYDEDTLTDQLRRGVTDVVQNQADAGVDIPSDGEFGKIGWTGYASRRFANVERHARPQPHPSQSPSKDKRDFAGFWESWGPLQNEMWQPPLEEGEEPPTGSGLGWRVTGPISYRDDEIKRDIANFKAALDAAGVEEGFLPVVAPGSIEVTGTNEHYATDEEFVWAIAEALKEEYRAVHEAGLIVQVDDAFLPELWDSKFGADRSRWDEYRAFSEVRVDALNYALQGIPEDRVRYHICWGSWNAPHSTDVPLKDIVDLVLKVNAQAYSVEAANPRHEHEWMVWEDVKLPEGKILIPGVVTHSTHIIEHPELVAWRIGNFARIVGRENVIAGTDCGFSQLWNLIRTHESVQWAKLRALREGADLATQQLWSRS